MTDKQIIIDEINAKAHAKTAFELAKESLIEKDQLKKYYDKLLWRKEQECEELTSKCSQLEEEFTKTTHVLLKIQYELSDNCNYYRQTLSEIKEIAEDTKDKFYDAIHTGGLYDRLEQIIKKINEVENVDND